MEQSIVAGWSDFLVAAAGSAAALAGLLFVAISINLARIIDLPGVSGRAGETIILLGATLATSLTALIPHLSTTGLSAALLAITIPAWIVPVGIQIVSIRRRAYFRLSHEAARAALHQIASLPGLLAGIALSGLLPGGLTWLAIGIIGSMLVALCNAWILLVEILR